MNRRDDDESYTPEETARRRDALLLQLLKTPPQPREELKIGKKRKPSWRKGAGRKRKKVG